MTGSAFFFFFQAEDGIRDVAVTGVQTCALPISARQSAAGLDPRDSTKSGGEGRQGAESGLRSGAPAGRHHLRRLPRARRRHPRPVRRLGGPASDAVRSQVPYHRDLLPLPSGPQGSLPVLQRGTLRGLSAIRRDVLRARARADLPELSHARDRAADGRGRADPAGAATLVAGGAPTPAEQKRAGPAGPPRPAPTPPP